MSGDVAALASWWHRELGLQCVHDDRFVPSCEKWATQFLRTGIEALAPLIAERVEVAKAEAWDEGYRAGVADERNAADVAIDAGPNRVNPYRAALDPEARRDGGRS